MLNKFDLTHKLSLENLTNAGDYQVRKSKRHMSQMAVNYKQERMEFNLLAKSIAKRKRRIDSLCSQNIEKTQTQLSKLKDKNAVFTQNYLTNKPEKKKMTHNSQSVLKDSKIDNYI